MYLTILLLGPLLLVAIVVHFTASATRTTYRAAQDPICQRLLAQRNLIVVDRSRSARGGSESDDALKHVDDQLKAEGCP
jgi:hypothetical protein